VIVPIGQKYRITDIPGQSLSLYVLCIKPVVFACDPQLAAALPSGRLTCDEATAARLSRDIRQLLFEQSRPAVPGTASQMTSLTLGLLAHMARQHHFIQPELESEDALPDAQQRMQQHIARLDQRFYESQSLDDAASATSLSRRRFTSLFREATGCSWLDFLHHLRIEYAKQLLLQTDRTVISSAFECGFDELSSFYRLFKRHEAVSPDQWRKQNR
jgi:AraC family L-rhamnose operon regulatory protein RhaS